MGKNQKKKLPENIDEWTKSQNVIKERKYTFVFPCHDEA